MVMAIVIRRHRQAGLIIIESQTSQVVMGVRITGCRDRWAWRFEDRQETPAGVRGRGWFDSK